jgi:hypothetical protein
MNALVRKEVRLMLPSWLTALALALVPFGVFWCLPVRSVDGPAHLALVTFSIGALMMALATFGGELGAGTFSALMSQPVSRLRLWRVKVSVLALAMGSILLVVGGFLHWMNLQHDGYFRPEYGRDYALACGFIALACFAGGLWTTLLLRQVAASLWLTILAPFAIYLAGFVSLETHEVLMWRTIEVLLAIYAIAGFLWARRMFLMAQDVPWTGGVVALPAWLGAGAESRPAVSVKRAPLAALMRKEFRSHHISLWFGAILLVLQIVALILRRITYDPSDPNKYLTLTLESSLVLWFGLPLVIGATTVAEERKHGTLGSELALPVSPWVRFGVKAGVALLLGTVLGGLMPAACDYAGYRMGIPSMLADHQRSMGPAAAELCGVAAGIVLLSMYASTLSRNLLQAMGMAIVTGTALVFTAIWAIEGFSVAYRALLWQGPIFLYFGLPVMGAVVLWLAYKNYCTLIVDARLWLRNGAMLLGSLAAVSTVLTLVYNRAWELVTPIEPAHGPAQLSGSVRPAICTVAFKTFVLLPDGRLWATRDAAVETVAASLSVGNSTNNAYHYEEMRMPVPADGAFIGGSDWVSLAASYNPAFRETNRWTAYHRLHINDVPNPLNQIAGVRSDGTLWTIYIQRGTNLSAMVEPVRIGGDSDWRSVAGGGGHFLALKRDGSLWGWGGNDFGELGAPTNEFTVAPDPVQIGTDSDWKAACVEKDTSVGLKRDGSVWKWGSIGQGPPGLTGPWDARVPHPVPMRWNVDGGDWAAFASTSMGSEGATWLALKGDGSFWVDGWVPFDLLGNDLLPGVDWQNRVINKPMQIGADSGWRNFTLCRDGFLAAIKENGTVVEAPLFDLYQDNPPLLFWHGVRRPSRYSDWLAVQDGGSMGMYLALAADGTVSVWDEPAWRLGGFPSLLGPTRKPLWSINILAAAK